MTNYPYSNCCTVYNSENSIIYGVIDTYYGLLRVTTINTLDILTPKQGDLPIRGCTTIVLQNRHDVELIISQI